MDYKKAYNEALERAKYLKENTDSVGALDISANFEYIFPELRESEDERIRKELIRDINIAMPIETAQKYIAWLKKQGEQKPIMIQWTGDNLKELVHFTGKSPKFEEWFKTWEDFENYVHTHNNIFKIFNEDGSHVEVPVGAWIIKTPDGYNVASRYVFKQKSNDKVEPKFNVGDWITNGEYTWKITDIKPLDYTLQSSDGDILDDTISYVDEEFHLWTTQDAKDGDVLANKYGAIFINAGSSNGGITLACYCYLSVQNKFCIEDHKTGSWFYKNNIKPATKEQCDLLFQKMHEAGYEWDVEKKKLWKCTQA